MMPLSALSAFIGRGEKLRIIGSDNDPSSLSLYLSLPPKWFFEFPPSPLPRVVPPGAVERSILRPFNIDPDVYSNLLDIRWPLTIGVLYAMAAMYLNKVNRQRGHKPWQISRGPEFFYFVLAHNFFLAVYSAWTFFGMLGTVSRSMPEARGLGGIVETVDALCKMNGPRGMGSAVTYLPDTGAWGVRDRLIHLADGLPDSSDVGRIWNEGLAYYGWIFYLSKFYEVVDTMIILAKGKESSLLQTYHHTGAMLCMWAGIRYMSGPIWMFVLVNSLIHALMYTYYYLSALSIRVPAIVKRSLTTMQIAQFVIGATYAALHLFISYTVPENVPYRLWHNLSTALPAATSAASSAIETGQLGNWLKKIALRAAGEEGLAENVVNDQGRTFGIDALHAQQVDKQSSSIRYQMDYPVVQCLDTSGQAFAIYLNVIYLLPLTVLFVQFFVRSYLKRTSSKTPHPVKARAKALQQSTRDAAHGLEREIQDAMNEEQGADTRMPPELEEKMREAREKLNEGYAEVSRFLQSAPQDFESKLQAIQLKIEGGFEDVRRYLRHKKEEIKKSTQGRNNGPNASGETYADQAKNAGTQLQEKAQVAAEKTSAKVQEGVSYAAATAQDVKDSAGPKIKQEYETVARKAHDVKTTIAETVSQSMTESTGSVTSEGNGSTESVNSEGNDSAESPKKGRAPKLPPKRASTASPTKSPVSENRTPSPTKPAQPNTSEAGYEANVDDITSKEEKEAEAELFEPKEAANGSASEPQSQSQGLGTESSFGSTEFGEDSGIQVSKEEAAEEKDREGKEDGHAERSKTPEGNEGEQKEYQFTP